MLTVACRDGAGSIGLFAVDAAARGRGIGKALLQDGKRWFLAHGCATAWVVTQGDNLPALHAYRQAGYCVKRTTFVHHLWLNPEAAS
jgi:ribosomal protein S18 acetylase RimI-like enzyme